MTPKHCHDPGGAKAWNRWTRSDLERLLAMHKAGHSWPDIALAVGHSSASCQIQARSLGLRKRVRGDASRDGEIRALHARGLNDTQIGLGLGLPRIVVFHRRRAMHLPSHGKRRSISVRPK